MTASERIRAARNRHQATSNNHQSLEIEALRRRVRELEQKLAAISTRENG